MEKLLEILKKVNSTVDFETQTALIDDEIIDSLELMELISEIEEEFNVEIEMEDIIPENFNTVAAIWELINRL